MANKAELADHLRTNTAAKVGALYYVSFGDDGPIKIGYVDGFGSLSERLRGLQTACPYDLTLLAVRAGSMADERALHSRFAKKRLRGEWFERHRELMQHVAGVCRRRDCREWIPRHSKYLPAPVGMRKLRCGKMTWLIAA